jgi:hypothetical protein
MIRRTDDRASVMSSRSGEPLAQMVLITALILRAGQVEHLGSYGFTATMSGLATSIAMGENGGPLLFIGRQDASHGSG